MAGTTVRMAAQMQYTLQEIHAAIHYIEGIEQISKREYRLDGAELWLLVYEKYYFRSNGYASLTVLLLQQGESQIVDIIASGGGASMSNADLGANRKLAKECVKALAEKGFTVDPEHSDEIPRSLIERLFK